MTPSSRQCGVELPTTSGVLLPAWFIWQGA